MRDGGGTWLDRLRGLGILLLGAACLGLGVLLRGSAHWDAAAVLAGCMGIAYGGWATAVGVSSLEPLPTADWRHAGLVFSSIVGAIVGLAYVFLRVFGVV